MHKKNISPRRIVVGAHYGIKDWLIQRLTAILIVAYILVLGVMLIFSSANAYYAWAGAFSHTWFKLFTMVVFSAVCYHAWIGVRDIIMDYIKPAMIRLLLYLFIVIWLLSCIVWAFDIFWMI